MADQATAGWGSGWRDCLAAVGRRIVHWRRTWTAHAARRRAEAELRALGPRELLDLGLDRGGIGHAVRHGRVEDDGFSRRPAPGSGSSRPYGR